MGTDNLHSRRKAKKAHEHLRHQARRQPYDKVLIVCEGEKTEPNYFSELKDYYELNTANVEIDGRCGSSPKSVVEHALYRYEKERKKDSENPFDRVYCVFDKDRHVTYRYALEKIADAKPQNVFYAIPSVPCFEYWLLLHFQYSTSPYRETGNKSVGDLAVSQLKHYLPRYEKGSQGIFLQLLDKLNDAKTHARRTLDAASQNNTDNPSTKVHELVTYLQNIKNNPA